MLSGYCDANSPLWFLPCLFLFKSLLLVLSRLTGDGRRNIWLCLPCVAGAAFLLFAPKGVRYPWGAQNVFVLYPFALLGRLAKYVTSKTPNPPRRTLLPLSLCLMTAGGSVALLLNGKVDVYHSAYGNPVLFYLSAALTLSGLYALCLSLKTCPPLEYAGRNSLGILVLHKFPVVFFQTVAPVIKVALRQHSHGMFLAVTVLSAALSCVGTEAVRRVAPWALGQRRV